jgi:RNA exonuclease 4
MKALLLTHPRQLIRDTSTYQPLRQLAKTKFPSLKKLTLLLLDIEIQNDSHCSVCFFPPFPLLSGYLNPETLLKIDVHFINVFVKVDDARATLAIYRTQKDQWEALVKKEQARQLQARPAT